MKTERHRDRVRRPNTDASEPIPIPNGSDGDLPGDGSDSDTPPNGHGGMDATPDPALTENGHATETYEDVDGAGNGHTTDAEAPGVVLTLARRRRRPPVAQQPAALDVAPVEEPAEVPEERVVVAPALPGVTLPPKARRKTPQPATLPVAVATTKVVEEAPAAAVTETGSTRWRPRITVEGLIWFSFLALAIFTRLWDLSNRGIHHDESLHAVYGNNLYSGVGYAHDPMMHGPLQFHLIAAMYWLFGTSEMAARMASAFCGIFVVMAPFFLRRQMGKVPALIASFLLLFSPGILYFSRMAREDSIYSAMEMIMIIGLWRFVSTRKPADFFIAAAGFSLMFTIKETAYLTTAVLGVFFFLLFVIQSGYVIMGATAVYGAAMGALLLFVRANMQERDASQQVVPNSGTIPPIPNIPVTNPNYDTIWKFITDLLTHPLVLGAIVLTVAYLIGLIMLFRMQRERAEDAETVAPVRTRSRVVAAGSTGNVGALRTRASRVNGAVAGRNVHAETESPLPIIESARGSATQVVDDPDAASEVWDPRRLDPKPGTVLGRYQPGSVPHLIGSLFARPSVLLIGFIIAAAIYTVFYTVFFTDIPRGLASGFFGSLGYWMAQQGVERGAQPWYFYFLLIPLYEPIAVFFSLAGTVFLSWRGVRWFFRRRAEARESDYPDRLGAFNFDRPVPFASFNSFMGAFLIFWLFGAVALYSWAGEKMPWLMVHMVRPAIMISAIFLGAMLLSILRRRKERVEAAAAYDERYANYGRIEPALAGGGMLRSTLNRLAPPGLQMAGALPTGGSASLDLQGGQVVAMSRGGTPPRSRPAAHTTRSRQAPPPRDVVPARRPARGRGAAAVAVARRQDPPWVGWNMPDSNFPALSFLTLFVTFAISWAMTMTFQTALNNNYATWSWTWIFPGMMLALVISFIAWVGPSRALRYLALGIFAVFFLYQFRSAMMLSYYQPDVPKEMASYVQTSPDVTRTMREIETYSKAVTGKNDIKVLYDSDTSWPFSWYFRDFKNASFIGTGTPQTSADIPVMVFGYDSKNGNQDLLKDYTAQRYAMRWWFPEDWYKKDIMKGLPAGETYQTASWGTTASTLLIKLGDTFTKPDNQATLWKYLLFRETPMPLGSTDMLVFVRKEVAPYYHYLQYQPNLADDLP